MEQRESDRPILCANNCGFFGNSATNNFCSKCYKDSIFPKNLSLFDSKNKFEDNSPPIDTTTSTTTSSSSTAGESKKPGANRCRLCNKKVGLMGFRCKCGELFCSMHRYSEKHGCEFDYRREGKDAIAKENPIVKADKVDKI